MNQITHRNELLTPHPSSPELSERARQYIATSLRPNSRRAYAAQIKLWLKWRGLSDLEPADAVDVANYVAERAAAGQSVSTLRTIIAAIKAGHEAKGWTFDSTAHVITRVLRGIANADHRLPRQAEPLRGSVLLSMLGAIAAGEPSIIDRRDAALLAVGYIFALRRSELVGLDFHEQALDADKGLAVLRMRRSTIEVVFAHSKTSNGTPEVVSVPRQNNAEAVKAIEAWVQVAGIKERQPLFWSLTKGGKLKGRLSDQSVSLIVKSRMAQHAPRREDDPSFRCTAFAETDRYSGHSLRVGFAVTAAECGADIRSIAIVTRHRSMAMPTRYAQQADQLRTSPHRLEGVGLDLIGSRHGGHHRIPASPSRSPARSGPCHTTHGLSGTREAWRHPKRYPDRRWP